MLVIIVRFVRYNTAMHICLYMSFTFHFCFQLLLRVKVVGMNIIHCLHVCSILFHWSNNYAAVIHGEC